MSPVHPMRSLSMSPAPQLDRRCSTSDLGGEGMNEEFEEVEIVEEEEEEEMDDDDPEITIDCAAILSHQDTETIELISDDESFPMSSTAKASKPDLQPDDMPGNKPGDKPEDTSQVETAQVKTDEKQEEQKKNEASPPIVGSFLRADADRRIFPPNWPEQRYFDLMPTPHKQKEDEAKIDDELQEEIKSDGETKEGTTKGTFKAGF